MRPSKDPSESPLNEDTANDSLAPSTCTLSTPDSRYRRYILWQTVEWVVANLQKNQTKRELMVAVQFRMNSFNSLL